jgi:hypothetical protein
MQMKVVEGGISKRDIQMMMIMIAKEGIQMTTIAKEGIQKRRHVLRGEERTYMGSQMESGRHGDSLEETRMPRMI